MLAIRFMLWRREDEEWRESPVDEGREEPPPFPIADADLRPLLEGLADLVIAARAAVAPPQVDAADPEQVKRFVYDILKDELEAMERAARRARLSAVPAPGGAEGA